MGACMSTGGAEDGDQKKKSQVIDRNLEEDSKKLRRECKILLLGTHPHSYAHTHARFNTFTFTELLTNMQSEQDPVRAASLPSSNR